MVNKKYIKALIYVSCFALAILFFYKAFVPMAPSLWEAMKSGDEAEIQAFLTKSGTFKGLVYLFLLQAIQVISIILPGAPIEIAGGMAYGFIKSFITCHVSFVFTNWIVFLFARRFKSDFLDGEKSEKMLAFLNKGDPFIAIVLCFMIPIMPNGIIPYAAAATRISAVKYVFGTFIGSSVQIFMMCAIGRKILSHDYLFMIIIVVLDFIAMFFLYKYRDVLNKNISKYGNIVRNKLKGQ